MTERYIRWDKVIVVILWLVVCKLVALTVAGILTGRLGEDGARLFLAVLFPVTALTGVLHIRLYAVRLCSVIRAASTVQTPTKVANLSRLRT